MIYHTKTVKKNNEKSHTAHFLISNFFSSKHSLNFQLKAATQSLLRFIGDMIDATASKIGIFQCSVKMQILALHSGHSKNSISKHFKILQDKKLINVIKRLEDNIPVIELGEALTVSQKSGNRPRTVSQKSETVSQKSRSGFPKNGKPYKEYNTNNNTNNNYDDFLKTEEKFYKQEKISPLLKELLEKKMANKMVNKNEKWSLDSKKE